jgi:hypothetical protein
MKATVLMQVSDLPQTISFYSSIGGKSHNLTANQALIDLYNTRLLVYQDEIKKDKTYLNHFYTEPTPDQQLIYITGHNVNNLQQTFDQLKITMIELSTSLEKMVIIKDNNNYRLNFKSSIAASDVELLEIYKSNINKIKKIIENLGPKDLETSLGSPFSNEKWTLRQHLNHLIEIEVNATVLVKFLLAESGREYNINGYDSDIWVENLRYDRLTINNSFKQFESSKLQLLELIDNSNASFTRYLKIGNSTRTLREVLHQVNAHTLSHIKEIQNYSNKEIKV